MKLLSRLWADEAGFVVSSELVLIATVMVVGLLTGMTTVRDQVVQELADVADAVSEIDQSYSYSSITGHSSSTAGSVFADQADFCDNVAVAGASAECIVIGGAATHETPGNGGNGTSEG